MQDDGEQETNPYLALRAAKIARNQARLEELGLVSFPAAVTRRGTSSSKQSHSASAKRLLSLQSRKVPAPVSLRRSNRLSEQDGQPNYVEDSMRESRSSGSRKRPQPENLDGHNDAQELERVPVPRLIRSPMSTGPPVRAPPPPNSVRSVSLHPNMIVHNFLGKPMEQSGKAFVVHQCFRVAAQQEDKDRRGDDPPLSFNKYSGVQEWKNVTFLWVNLVATKQRDGTVRTANRFLHDGKFVTWFGGSRMWEDSPAIQSLIAMETEAIATIPSAIVLWCRLPLNNGDGNGVPSSSMGPYVCLGRLAYHSHDHGSHPVAFTWRLIDYNSLAGATVDSETRERFKGIVQSTI